MQQRLRTAACRVVARASLLARPVAVAAWLLPGLVVLAPLPVAAQESLLPALAARYGPQAAQRGEQLVALLQRLRRAPVAQQLDRVNTFFNGFAYRADRALWRKADHWSTPLEFIGRGGGDCEDFAIGKYFALRWLGVTPDALRVARVLDLRSGRSHMVLHYLPPDGARTLVLDSLERRVLNVDQRPDLAPVLAFNEARLTVGLPGGGERSFPLAGRWSLLRWRALLARAGDDAVRIPLPAARRAQLRMAVAGPR